MDYEVMQKQIPSSLYACSKDPAAAKVQMLAVRLSDISAVICFLMVVVGFAVAFILTSTVGGLSESAGIWTFCLTLLSFCIGAVAVHFYFRFMALMLNTLATITLNTSISANVALYEASLRQQAHAEAPKGETPVE